MSNNKIFRYIYKKPNRVGSLERERERERPIKERLTVAFWSDGHVSDDIHRDMMMVGHWSEEGAAKGREMRERERQNGKTIDNDRSLFGVESRAVLYIRTQHDDDDRLSIR